MADNIPAVIAFGIALAAPILVRSAMRPRSVSWHGYVALVGEMFAVVLVAAIAYYASYPAIP